ncbi:MAG: BlaI/MecI/CopY family transcriptional regulator [Lachnospiraceae bacterium]|nr:BlaI/MecI/CopY family transcriptional regulator [Lachnospiraceae bacterium]
MVNISDAEWKIMNILWDNSPLPCTITQLTKILSSTTGWTKHTVMALLKRLEEKDAVYYEDGERAKQYYAKIPQNEAMIEETKSFLDKTFKGKLGLMINTLISEEAISKEEMDELYHILEQKREKE